MDQKHGYPHPNAPQGYPHPQDPYQGGPPQGPYPGYPPAQAPYPVYPPLDQFQDKPSDPGFQVPPPSYTAYPNVPVEVQPTPTVVPMATITPVGPDPKHLVCPSCHAQITTRVEHEASARTHIIAAILCLFICWPCVCLPYCMDSCRNANHYCPNCKSYLGTYKS